MLLAILAVLVLGGTSALAASSSSPWHVGYYTPGGSMSNTQAGTSGGGLASLNFTSQPNTALLVTSQKAKNSSLLGNMAGKTITATFTVNGTDAFTYYGQPDACNTPASARLYFETSNGGGFDYTHYWWSNPASAVLANGTLSVSATVDPASWSDWNGQSGTSVPAGFAAAASNVTTIGLSFGGGCFFENGVGTANGMGGLVLDSYTAN